MDDLISRQAVKDALAKLVPYAICDTSTESYTNGLTDAYNLICQLPSAQPEQKWIPCSERLPDSRRSVLITVSNGKDYETSEAYYHELRKDWFEVNGDRVCEMSPPWKTIAWCELPEPWKGEEE